ncbi:diacylglycerol kinase family protein [Paenibacillus sp. 481]|uniref:diacylglycerol kinase family protein n=1 Tax=Paenibacillus sp. 481 TaxID=2835869 RepID=UPI001E47C914|nr:diacylglycerol kinase family protein [Paenibacillus sp. 481]UHA74166.1 diacylglycerol kinase family protein [Paenibacillus sp. 481]
MKRPWSDTFQVALVGIVHTFRTQRNMRVHGVLSMLVCAMGVGFGISVTEWMWIGLAITLVWSAELMNTAVEAAVDLTMPDPHPLAKIAKDTAAGAVFVTAVFAVFVGGIVFFQPMLELVILIVNHFM